MPRWSAKNTISALAAIPAPLRTEKQAEAFHEAVALLQEAPSRAQRRPLMKPATAEVIRVIDATLCVRGFNRFANELLFGLKMLAYMGTREGAEMVIRAARKPLDPDGYLWTVAFAPFGEGHPFAKRVFSELSNPLLPDKFMGVCLLDAANEAARDHGLSSHPFNSREGQSRLRSFLTSSRADGSSYAVSACAALPFLSAARRKPLIALARKHQEPFIRMEIAWATANLGDKSGLKYLIDATLDPNYSCQACHYLSELGRKKLIPKAAKDPDFAALAEMCEWLAHPNEFGEPPTNITMFDKRKIYWPPTRDERIVRLFKYEYAKSRHRPKKDVGIGMVGSETFSLFDTTSVKMTPEENYGLHCCYELEGNEDPRTPKKRSGKAGWRLIERGA